MKKIIVMFLIAVISASFLAGCTKDETSSFFAPITNQKAVSDTSKIQELDGQYFDRTSHQATAILKQTGDATAVISVIWGSSVSEYTQWTMNVTLLENNILSYTDEMKEEVVADKDGTLKKETKYADRQGYFTLKSGMLRWDGAYERDCRECKFEKITVS